MARTTNAPASRARRKRVLKKAKGFRGNRSKLFRYAKDATMKSQTWAYRDRKNRKRNFRALWITRVSAILRGQGMTFSKFIASLKKANIDLNRKMLAELATNEPKAFEAIVKAVK